MPLDFWANARRELETVKPVFLLYNGQEAGSDRRLEFFDKNVIEWREHEQGELYRRLLALKKRHPALWNGAWGPGWPG